MVGCGGQGQNCAKTLGPQSQSRAPPLPQLPLRGGRAPGQAPAAHLSCRQHCPRHLSRPLFCQLGFPASSPFWAQRGQTFGDKPTEQPVGELGVEQASRNEKPGQGEGHQGRSLLTGLSVLISHGAWSETSLRPFTHYWGPDPRGLPSPRGHRQLPPSGEAGVCEAGWGWRVVRTPRGQEWWRASRGRVDKSPARPGREASRVWL